MRLLICCIAFVFANFVNAQTVSDEMKADTRRFLELTGALRIGEQMGNAISQQIIAAMKSQNANVPDAVTGLVVDVVREHINSFVASEEVVNGLIEIYAKHYTRDDIVALIDFYNTPLGAKMLAVTPLIAQESAVFGQTLFLQRVPQIQKDIQDRLQASGLIQQTPAPQPPQQ